MNAIPFRKTTAAVLAASMLSAILSGCVTEAQIDRSKGAAQATEERSQQALDSYFARVRRDRATIDRDEDVDVPFIAGAPVALSRDATLPLALRNKVIAHLSIKGDTATFESAVAALQDASHVPFRIEPDVYLPQPLLEPKLQAGTSSAAPAQAAVPAPVATPAISSGPMPSLSAALASTPAQPYVAAPRFASAMMVSLPTDGKDRTTTQYADLIANQLGINWDYDAEKGVGHFYRLVTKTYRVPVGAGARPFTNEFKSSTQEVSSAGGTATANTTPETLVRFQNDSEKQTPLAKIAAQLDTVMTKAGAMSFNEDTGTITLRDTKEAVENADRVIHSQVAVLNKLIELRFQSVQVTVNDTGESAVNWALRIQGALSHVPGLALGSSPASQASSNAGSVGFTVLDGAFQGSSMVVQALNEIGQASASIDVPFTMRNRRAATWNTRQLFYFLSGSSAGAGTVGGSTSVPGYTQSSGTVGFKLFLYPDADNDDTVNLSVSFDSSVLNSIGTITTGQGTSQQTFQQPDISGNGIGGQEVPIRNGQTVLLTGFDQNNASYDKRTMGSKVPMLFGGSLTASHKRTFTLVFATVHIVDQGYGS
jgi:type IVB pilus formation R64 PilN family outer membrane protein